LQISRKKNASQISEDRIRPNIPQWMQHTHPEPEHQPYSEVNIIKGSPHPFRETPKSSPIQQALGREEREE